MNNLKKITSLFALLILFVSCSIEGDEIGYHLELLKIESVEMPNTLILGQTHQIKVKYKRPTTCHAFNDFVYEKDLNIRTIAVQSQVIEQSNCSALSEVIDEATLNFVVTNNGSYIFKFWQGTNDNGEDEFIEIEIPVED